MTTYTYLAFIDALFVGPGITVIQTTAIDSPDVRAASDHRPVVADLYVADRPAGTD